MGHHGNSFLSFVAVAPVGGWVELARTTLVSAQNDISVSSIPDKRYYMILHSHLTNGTSMRVDERINNLSSTTYADRRSDDGTADTTAVNSTEIHPTNAVNTDEDHFDVQYFANLSAKEKLMMGWNVGQSASGAGTAPNRVETVGKNSLTSGVMNRIDWIRNAGTGQMNSGSEIVVLGWDPADVHTTNFWEQLASADLLGGSAATLNTSTFTSKKYLWVQAYLQASGSVESLFRVGNTTIDTASNYAVRRSLDGATDVTAGPQSSLNNGASFTTAGLFNIFIINNASNEKLVISHSVVQNTAGAGTAPQRAEMVGKWTNTSNQIDIVGFLGGTFDTGSFIKVWGSD